MHRSIRLGLTLIAVAVAYSGVQYAYTLTGDPAAHWPDSAIPVLYHVDPTNRDGLLEADVIAAI